LAEPKQFIDKKGTRTEQTKLNVLRGLNIPLLKHELFNMLRFVKKFGTVVILLGIALIANAFVAVAHADEPRPSAFQTALSNTTLFDNFPPACGDSTDTNVVIGGDTINAAGLSSSFSVSSVPEPSSVGLIAVGSVVFAMVGVTRQRSLYRTNRS
jgi:hypothetical protein